MQWMICTMLDFVMSISLDIWHIEQYVCFWPLWSSKPAILFTMIMFSSVRVCFSLLVSCLWSVLHVSQIFVNSIPTLSRLQLIFENSASILWKLYFLNWYTFLFKALSSLLNGTFITSISSLHQKLLSMTVSSDSWWWSFSDAWWRPHQVIRRRSFAASVAHSKLVDGQARLFAQCQVLFPAATTTPYPTFARCRLRRHTGSRVRRQLRPLLCVSTSWIAKEDDCQVATCSQRTCVGRVKLRQVQSKT